MGCELVQNKDQLKNNKWCSVKFCVNVSETLLLELIQIQPVVSLYNFVKAEKS